MDEKQPLFEVEHCMTEEEYIMLCKEVDWKKRRNRLFLTDIPLIAIMLCIGIMYYQAFRSPLFILFAFGLLLISTVFFCSFTRLARFGARRTWRTFPQRDETVTVCFYDEYLTTETGRGMTRWDYAQFYRLIETPTHFYIMLSMVQGIPLKKDALTEENAAFIRALAPKKEKKRKRG